MSERRLAKISIEDYKAFHRVQSIPIAQSNGQIGSGLTVIVGQNNSGKSTVLDVFLFLQRDKRIPQEDRHDMKPVQFILTDNGGHTCRISNIDNGSQISVTGGELNASYFEFVPSRRHWNHRFGNQQTYEEYRHNSFGAGRQAGLDGYLGPLLAEINRSPRKKETFNLLVRRVLPSFNNWTVDSDEGGDYIQYSTGGGTRHRTDRFGDGVISLFRIVAHVSQAANNKILIIDEPELSLHPQAQRALALLLAEQSKDKQIIVATHSPHFVRWSDLEAGAQIVRVRKRNDKVAEVFHIPDVAAYKQTVFSMEEDWQKPQLLDAVAKEMFFSESLVFVEGQEDVALLRRYIDQENIIINFEFFGYGCGGAGNIPKMLQMARDLGIGCAALFDGDKATDAARSTSEYPDAKILVLPTDDIRDKHKQESKDGRCADTAEILKEGVFDRRGTVKPAYATRLREIITEFNAHFGAPVA